MGSTHFDDFCEALNQPPFKSEHLLDLPFGDPERLVTIPGGLTIDFAILNYAKWIKAVRHGFDGDGRT